MRTSRIHKRAGSPYYQCVYYDAKGQRYRESTNCTDRQAAEAYLRNAERRAQSATAQYEAFALRDAVTYFLTNVAVRPRGEFSKNKISLATHKFYCEKSEALVRLIGDCDIHAIAKADVRDKFIKPRQTEDVTDHTIKKELVTLRRVLSFLEEEEKFHGSIKAVLPEFDAGYKPREVWLTPDQYSGMHRHLSPRYALWADLAVYTGGRHGEINDMDWSYFNWAAGQVWLPGTKTDTAPRWVPIMSQLGEKLSSIRKTSGPIFPKRSTKLHTRLHIACDKAGVPRVSPNDLRRTYASWLIQAGNSLKSIATLLGHKSTQMAERVYAQLEKEVLKRTARDSFPIVPLIPNLSEQHVAPAPVSPPPAPAPAPKEEVKLEVKNEKPEDQKRGSRFSWLEID